MTDRVLLFAPDGQTPLSVETDEAARAEQLKSITALLITSFGALLGLKPGRPPMQEGSHEALEFRHTLANMIMEYVGQEKLEKLYGCSFVPPEDGRAS